MYFVHFQSLRESIGNSFASNASYTYLLSKQPNLTHLLVGLEGGGLDWH